MKELKTEQITMVTGGSTHWRRGQNGKVTGGGIVDSQSTLEYIYKHDKELKMCSQYSELLASGAGLAGATRGPLVGAISKFGAASVGITLDRYCGG